MDGNIRPTSDAFAQFQRRHAHGRLPPVNEVSHFPGNSEIRTEASAAASHSHGHSSQGLGNSQQTAEKAGVTKRKMSIDNFLLCSEPAGEQKCSENASPIKHDQGILPLPVPITPWIEDKPANYQTSSVAHPICPAPVRGEIMPILSTSCGNVPQSQTPWITTAPRAPNFAEGGPTVECSFRNGVTYHTFYGSNYMQQLERSMGSNGSGGSRSPRAGPAEPRPKRPWSDLEDDALRSLVAQHGAGSWAVIAQEIPGRTGKQVRERWLNHLSPEVSKRPWSSEEDRLIIYSHQQFGNCWSRIARLLPGRSDNSVKNRFYTTLRRRLSTAKNTNVLKNEKQVQAGVQSVTPTHALKRSMIDNNGEVPGTEQRLSKRTRLWH